MPQIFMIAGPNGAGKTTSAINLLPDIIHCQEYINADSIATALSPYKPESIAIKAGRLMLERIHYLADQRHDFAFETTGASKTFASFLLNCKRKGYYVNLLYLWLESPDLALERVASRVENGGHNVPESVVRKRYRKGLINIFQLYIPIVDNWVLYDNSGNYPKLIAKKNAKSDILVNNQEIWQMLNKVT